MKCPICGRELSSYNETGKCWSHAVAPGFHPAKRYAMEKMPAHGTLLDIPFKAVQAEYNGRTRYHI